MRVLLLHSCCSSRVVLHRSRQSSDSPRDVGPQGWEAASTPAAQGRKGFGQKGFLGFRAGEHSVHRNNSQQNIFMPQGLLVAAGRGRHGGCRGALPERRKPTNTDPGAQVEDARIFLSRKTELNIPSCFAPGQAWPARLPLS